MTLTADHPYNNHIAESRRAWAAYQKRHSKVLAEFACLILLLVLFAMAFLISMPFGLAVTFFLTLALAIYAPSITPSLMITAFLFQNMIIASFIPFVEDQDGFNAIRGLNFVILITIYGAFLLSWMLNPRQFKEPMMRWSLFIIAALGVILFYLAIGIVRGEANDALIYFRNTLTPIACLHIGLMVSYRYRSRISDLVFWLGLVIALYGYCELFFEMDFLSLFNGDDYIRYKTQQQIDNGYWEKKLQQTGFVLQKLEDVMTTHFLNSRFFMDILPPIFRLSGPNFHPISYAYAMAVISVWFMLKGRWFLPLFMLPLLTMIGSKGALLFYISALLCCGCLLIFTRKMTVTILTAVTITWLCLAIITGFKGGDYHVLGLIAGIKAFLGNPLGQGLGIGGNLSSTAIGNIDWQESQATGIATLPVESAIGVLLYQMGVGAFAIFALFFTIYRWCLKNFLQNGSPEMLFGIVSITVITANAILQEEAYYAPLAWGFCMLLLSTALLNGGANGTSTMPEAPATKAA